MRFALVSVLSIATLATALPSGSSHDDVLNKREDLDKRATCETKFSSQFRFNDTTVSSIESCTVDVLNRGIEGPKPTRPENSTCTNGPRTSFTVSPNDSLEGIALTFDTGVCNIAEANSISDPDFIVPGQQLIIPSEMCQDEIDSMTCRTPLGREECVDPNAAGASDRYTVVSGDTFSRISWTLDITPNTLVAANPDVDASALQMGQVINVPLCQ
ncbi:intracellular hyphae protein 1 [Diaporthe helianthi]|uniref:Intracellular hyphae protein 1 n=1 Tax=Diaporthe helianthi TaxID=158607 RepID=A0A2P5HTH5_DIAHE|nr:intracellular hyphae protein 1 [Diaporthe helianthi]